MDAFELGELVGSLKTAMSATIEKAPPVLGTKVKYIAGENILQILIYGGADLNEGMLAAGVDMTKIFEEYVKKSGGGGEGGGRARKG